MTLSPPSLVLNRCWYQFSTVLLYTLSVTTYSPPPSFPTWKQCDPPLNPSHPPPPPRPKYIKWSPETRASLLLASFPSPPPFFLTYEWLHDVSWVITLPQLFCDPSAYCPYQAFQYERRTFYHPDRTKCGRTRVRGSQDGGGVGRGWKEG